MSDPIKGKYAYIEWQKDDLSWKPILCGIDLTLNYEPEFVLKTGPNSPARERAPRIEDWSASISGLTLLDDDSSKDSFFTAILVAQRRQLKSFRARFVDDAGTNKSVMFSAFIGPSSITGPTSDFCLCNINLVISGGVTDITSTPAPVASLNYDLLSDWWTTSNGNAFINGASNQNAYTLVSTDVILDVAVEGFGFDIILSGSPGNRQCKPDLANNKILFQNAFDGTQKVYVQFKRPI